MSVSCGSLARESTGDCRAGPSPGDLKISLTKRDFGPIDLGMKPSIYSPFLIAVLALLLATGSPASAQTTETKVKKLPFHGKLASVDTSAQTITLSGKSARVFHLTSTTKITDGAGNPSSLSAAVVGEDVGGSYTKDASGTMTLNSVRFGAKAGSKEATASTASKTTAATPAASTPTPAPAPAPATESAVTPAPSATPAPVAATAPTTKAKKEKFSGKVVSVDTAANTLVVHGKTDQTFTLTSATKVTGGTLAGLAAGTKVTGTYTKSADGATLTVATLKIAP